VINAYHVPPWFLYVRSLVHIARVPTGANRGRDRRRTLRARISRLHGTPTPRLTYTKFPTDFDASSPRGQRFIRYGIYPTANVIIPATNRGGANPDRRDHKSQCRATNRKTGMTNINYLSLDIIQRLQRWRTSEDVNDLSGSRPWWKVVAKVSRNTGRTFPRKFVSNISICDYSE
jgi:hypothetical protein